MARLLVVLCLCLFALPLLADCPGGTHFEPDGGLSCAWYQDFVTGQWSFACGETGDCISDCYPYECADELAAVANAMQPAEPWRRFTGRA